MDFEKRQMYEPVQHSFDAVIYLGLYSVTTLSESHQLRHFLHAINRIQ